MLRRPSHGALQRALLPCCLVFSVALAACSGNSPQEGSSSSGGVDGGALADGGCRTALDCPDPGNLCVRAVCAAGSCTTAPNDGLACSDGDKCTVNDSCKAGACEAGTNLCECQVDKDCAAREDGDPCNGTLRCDTSKSVHVCVLDPKSLVSCDNKNDTVCQQNLCNPKNGICMMRPVADGTACDDGEACTKDDICKSGQCKASGASWCECQSDADCAGKTTDKCLGTWYCGAGFPRVCKLNAATAVTCPSGKDTACLKNQCDPAQGACKMTAQQDGLPCDDGDIASVSDVCTAGQCKGTTVKSCVADADCAKFEDGDFCNGVLFCDQSDKSCKVNPATVVSCPSVNDTSCIKNTCDPQSGVCVLTPSLNGKPCSDDDVCTQGDHCWQASCKAGKFTCLCKTDADCANVDDGNKCNGVPYCDKPTGQCKDNPSSVVLCQSVTDTDCSKTACDPSDGQCKQTAAADVVTRCDVPSFVSADPCRLEVKPPKAKPLAKVLCSDGDACTSGDQCDGKVCKPGTKICGCTKDADCADPDSDVCTGVPYCDLKSGTCKPNPATAISCSKKNDTTCEETKCHPVTGLCQLTPRNEGKACDDGEPCTDKDTCQAGACKGGAKACDDGDACTKDTCIAGKGCQNTKVVCDDGNSCTVELCEPKTGTCSKPVAGKQGTPCNADDNPCTAGDSCDQGSCKAGQPVVCPPTGNDCLEAKCTAVTSAVYSCAPTARPDGTPCPGKDAGCLVGSACKAGSCVAGSQSRYGTYTHAAATAKWRYEDVAPWGEGAVIVGSQPAGSGRAWLVLPTDKAGAAGKPIPVKLDKAGADNSANQVETSASHIFIAGGMHTAQGVRHSVVIQLDKDGKEVARIRPKPPRGDAVPTTFTHFARASAGPMVAAGVYTHDKISATNPQGTNGWFAGDHAYYVRLSPTGKVVSTILPWFWPAKHWLKAPTRVQGLALTSSGDVFIAHADAVDSSAGSFWVHRYSSADKELWIAKKAYADKGPIGGTLRVVGDTVQFTWSTWAVKPAGGKAGAARLLRTFIGVDDGLPLHKPDEGQPFVADHRYTRGFPLGDAMVLLGQTKGTDDAQLTVFDRFANVQVERSFAATGATWALADGAQLPDGTLAIVGNQKSSQGERGTLQLLSPWLHDDCATAGGCATKALAACDDGKGCTKDICSPSLGCTHAPFHGAACAPVGACAMSATCDGTTCKPDAAGAFHAYHSKSTPKQRYVEAWPVSKGKVTAVHTGSVVTYLPTDIPYVVQGCGLSTVVGGVALPNQRYALLGTNGNGQAQACGVARSEQQVKPPTVWKAVLNPFGWKGQWRDLSVSPTGSVWAVAQVHQPNYSAVARMTINGSVLGSFIVADGQGVGDARGIVALNDGRAVVVGSAKTGAGQRAGFCRMKADGKPDTPVFVGGSDTDQLYDVAATADGGVLAVGASVSASGAIRSRMARISPAGKLVWEAVPKAADATTLRAIVPEDSLEFTIAGERTVVGVRRGYIAQITGAGDVLWEQTTAQNGGPISLTVGGLRRLDNGYLLLGAQLWNGSLQPWYARVGLWGHGDCVSPGLCALKSQGDCDDGNPCTADVCNDKTGKCAHVPVTGTVCAAGKTCQAGVCSF